MQEFRTESKKILDLVVNSIYSTKDVFLRELISNASDALDKVALEISAGRLEADQVGELAIELDFDVAERTITVSDNGIGMDAEARERDLGTIAHSSSLEAKLSEGLQDDDVEIIGQFGVGFYSGFMVADEIVVVSRALGCDAAFEWRSDGSLIVDSIQELRQAVSARQTAGARQAASMRQVVRARRAWTRAARCVHIGKRACHPMGNMSTMPRM